MKQANQKRPRQGGRASSREATVVARREQLEREHGEAREKVEELWERLKQMTTRATNRARQLRVEQDQNDGTQKVRRDTTCELRRLLMTSADSLQDTRAALRVREAALEDVVELTRQLQGENTEWVSANTVAQVTIGMMTRERDELKRKLSLQRDETIGTRAQLEKQDAEIRGLRRQLEKERTKEATSN